MLFLSILVQVGLSRCIIGGGEQGLFQELNPGPLAPEARIIPLDQAAIDLWKAYKN